jgi:hypothetical protein
VADPAKWNWTTTRFWEIKDVVETLKAWEAVQARRIESSR